MTDTSLVDDARAADCGQLLGIRETARRTGCSERALRYYQQMGLVTPTASTPGGMRRYSDVDLERVGRIRQLQTLLGLDLDEIRAVLTHQDRLGEIRQAVKAAEEGDPAKRDLVTEAVGRYEELRSTVCAKLDGLQEYLDEIDASLTRARDFLDRTSTG